MSVILEDQFVIFCPI